MKEGEVSHLSVDQFKSCRGRNPARHGTADSGNGRAFALLVGKLSVKVSTLYRDIQ